MPDKDFQMERHYELWKDHNKQMSRWVFALLFLAIFIPLKVLSPYLKSADELVVKIAELEETKNSLDKINMDETFLNELESELEEVKKNIDAHSWVASIEQLKTDFKRLDDAYDRLQRKTPKQLFEEIPRLSRSSPVQQRTFEATQTDIESMPENDLQNDLIILRIFKEDLRAKNSGDETRIINPTPISEQEYKLLLERKLRERPQKMADNAITETTRAVQTHVVNPVNKLISKYKGKTKYLDGLPAKIDELIKNFKGWQTEYVGNKTWYRDVSTKNSEMDKVTGTLIAWQEPFSNNINARKEDVQKNKKNAVSQQEKANIQIANLKKEQIRLKGDMNAVFPEWMRGFVDIKEMFQLYPVALIGIIGFLGFKANLLRHHFLVIRQGLIPKILVEKDPSASSVWTLIYRGPLGTMVTALTYLVITLFFWNLFEGGTSLTESWLANSGEEAWPFIKEQFGVIIWLGHIIFLAALLAIAMSLFLDWKNRTSAEEQSAS